MRFSIHSKKNHTESHFILIAPQPLNQHEMFASRIDSDYQRRRRIKMRARHGGRIFIIRAGCEYKKKISCFEL
jgi:hypothetical protein